MSAVVEPNQTNGLALIDPSTPAENGGLDNENFDLIVYENMQIVDPAEQVYTITGNLGSGQFGRVYSVTLTTPEGQQFDLAMKISKSTQDSRDQFEYEAQALSYIKANTDEEDIKYITDIYSYFMYNEHMCIILDRCGNSMLSDIENGQFEGLPLARVQSVIRDTLIGLNILHNLSVIHTDVKPENIVNVPGTDRVKLIDLGSCTVVNNLQPSYAQSRYYRAPEVAFRLEYGIKADIWSTGCVAAELMLGLPLFPAETERHLVCLIEEMLGPYPASLREATERHDEFFLPDESLKSPELICEENGETFTDFNPYFVQTRLDDIIMNFSFAEGLTDEQIAKEESARTCFIDFLQKMLKLDPSERMDANEALNHQFMQLRLD